MFSIIIEIGVPVVIIVSPSASSMTPESTLTRSSSRRWVTKRDWPGLRLSSQACSLRQREAEAGRAAVDDAAERRPVAFAPGGYAEEMTECIVRHVFRPDERKDPDVTGCAILQNAGHS